MQVPGRLIIEFQDERLEKYYVMCFKRFTWFAFDRMKEIDNSVVLDNFLILILYNSGN